VPLLAAHELVKSYGGRRVVDGVSFTVDEGEIVGILGRNGAGKTTSFRMAIGMISPESGSVEFDGVGVVAVAGLLGEGVQGVRGCGRR
jgi:lipopolysaccharide export system ATP-binding protein